MSWKCCRRVIAHDEPNSVGMHHALDNFFAQVDRTMTAYSSGPEAYTLLGRLITTHFDSTDQGASCERLCTFGVPSRTEFVAYFVALHTLVSSISSSE